MMNNEKLIYLSLGVLAVIGILVTFILVGKARNLDQQAASANREGEVLISPLTREASPSGELAPAEATPSGEEASPSAGEQ